MAAWPTAWPTPSIAPYGPVSLLRTFSSGMAQPHGRELSSTVHISPGQAQGSRGVKLHGAKGTPQELSHWKSLTRKLVVECVLRRCCSLG